MTNEQLTAEIMNRKEMLENMEGIAKAEIIGTWLWVWFNAKPSDKIREQLKANGFTWRKNKAAWAWHDPEEKQYRHKEKSIEEIKSKYQTIKLF